MKENVLYIPPIPQYGVIIEDPQKAQFSIFNEAYRRAADNVMKIIKSSKRYKKDDPASREEFLNTIVAFTGDRGSGKSSAMLSFAKMLKEPKLDFWKMADESRKDDYKHIQESSFWVLPALDSTKMRNGEQLLASVAARMFKEYKSRVNAGKIPHTITVEQKQEFLTQIQKAIRESVMEGRDKKEEDESILLQDTVEQIDARECVKRLVDIFLKMMFDKSENAYLVIPIDDLDMNLSDSYGIVDDIRKHLTIPHVIVLTSICIDQFRELAAIHYGKLFNEKHERCSSGDVMAQKYVEKMFPVSRQVEMPKYTLEQQRRTLIGNLIGEKKDEEKGESPKKSEPTKRTDLGLKADSDDSLNIVEGVLHLIYRKTMLLLVPDENGRHWIVPSNLRELCNLIYFLQGMEDVAFTKNENGNFTSCGDDDFLKSGEDRLNTMENNLRRLMQYIVSDLLDYSTDGMSDDVIQMAKTLSKLIRELPGWPLTGMNRKIVRDILSCMSSENSYSRFFNKDLRESLLQATMHNNLISMGDVQHVLGAISHRTNSETIKKLIEYVQMIWSIRMTIEFFCVGVRYSNDSRHSGSYEVSGDGFYITKDFRDTVGGPMFSPDAEEQLLKYTPAQNDVIGVDRNWLWIKVGQNEKIKPKDFWPLDLMTVFSKAEMPKNGLVKQFRPEAVSEAVSKAADAVLPTYTPPGQSAAKREKTVNEVLQKAALEITAKAFAEEYLQEVMSGSASVLNDWRTCMNGSYYRALKGTDDGSAFVLYLNYFAIFTNLLSPQTVYFLDNYGVLGVEASAAPRINLYLDWVKQYTMVFPFYSMDWTNRFYAALERIIQGLPQRRLNYLPAAVIELNGYIRKALIQMENVTKVYITPTIHQALSGNDYKYRFDSLMNMNGETIGDVIITNLRILVEESMFEVNRPMSSFVRILKSIKEWWSSHEWSKDIRIYHFVSNMLTSNDSSNPIPPENHADFADIIREFEIKYNINYQNASDGIPVYKQLIDDVIKKIKKDPRYLEENPPEQSSTANPPQP